MENRSDHAKEEIKSRKRRETIQERRRRILGSASVRFTNTTDQDATDRGASSESEYSRRRHQVRRAQRYHRQRTMDYIEDLETEIIRLRGPCPNTMNGDGKEPPLPILTSNGAPSLRNMNVTVLVEVFDGQIAPGVCVASPYQSQRVSESSHRKFYLMQGSVSRLHCTKIFYPALRALYSRTHSLEPRVRRSFDQDALLQLLVLLSTRALKFFCSHYSDIIQVSENIASTLVVFDGPSNGFRCHMLPLAWDKELVRYALLAISANHMRFRHHQLLPLALNFQSTAIEKLSAMSKTDNPTGDTRVTVLATIILLLITDMMNGGPQFHLLFGMVTSWIDATNCGPVPLTHRTHHSDIEVFLLDQLDMVRRYAKPLTIERHAINKQGGSTPLTFPTGTLRENLTRIFKSISEAIKYTCYIYYYHIMNNTIPPDLEDVLDKLKDTTQHIPPYAPGENSLAWVYFVAAAESSVPTRRIYFTRRLMGILERGSLSNPAPAFAMLHHIWNCHDFGRSWTKYLRGKDSFPVTLSPT